MAMATTPTDDWLNDYTTLHILGMKKIQQRIPYNDDLPLALNMAIEIVDLPIDRFTQSMTCEETCAIDLEIPPFKAIQHNQTCCLNGDSIAITYCS